MKTKIDGRIIPLFIDTFRKTDIMSGIIYGCIWKECKRRDGKSCFLTKAGIAKLVGVSKGTVNRHVQKLQNTGMIIASPRWRGFNFTLPDDAIRVTAKELSVLLDPMGPPIG